MIPGDGLPSLWQLFSFLAAIQYKELCHYSVRMDYGIDFVRGSFISHLLGVELISKSLID